MSVDSAAELVERYLAAYKAGDMEGMNACTDPEFTFCDPAFSQLDCTLFPGDQAISNKAIHQLNILEACSRCL